MEVHREVEPGFAPDEQQPSAPYGGTFAASQEHRATPKAGLHAKSGAPPVFATSTTRPGSVGAGMIRRESAALQSAQSASAGVDAEIRVRERLQGLVGAIEHDRGGSRAAAACPGSRLV